MNKLDGMLTACKVVKHLSHDFKQTVIWCLHRVVIVGKMDWKRPICEAQGSCRSLWWMHWRCSRNFETTSEDNCMKNTPAHRHIYNLRNWIKYIIYTFCTLFIITFGAHFLKAVCIKETTLDIAHFIIRFLLQKIHCQISQIDERDKSNDLCK